MLNNVGPNIEIILQVFVITSAAKDRRYISQVITQNISTCSKSTIEKQEKGVKYV